MEIRPLLVMGFASVCLLAPVWPAYADNIDDKFLSDLRSEGISDHLSNSHAIDAGHVVCVQLDNGMSTADVVNDVLNSSQMPAYHSGFFVGASIDAYCPRHKADIPKS
jgi:Protein of unknown function (DUF732)